MKRLNRYSGAISDSHTHCSHSHDSDTPPEKMLKAALKNGAVYYAFTDHDDRDYLYNAPEYCYKEVSQLDVEAHIEGILSLKDKYKDKIYVGLGIECSYAPEAAGDYLRDLGLTDEWDVVLNSVHSVDGYDIYLPAYFEKYGRKGAYIRYFESVFDSLSVPYGFDVVGHLGYVARKAPYAEKNAVTLSEFGDYLDQIFKKMIDTGKSLEINTNARNTGADFLPSPALIGRYIELGGKDFTIGSDAHRVDRVLENFGAAADMLKSFGIEYINVYKKRVKTPLKL